MIKVIVSDYYRSGQAESFLPSVLLKCHPAIERHDDAVDGSKSLMPKRDAAQRTCEVIKTLPNTQEMEHSTYYYHCRLY
jgi:hypothetical protein